MGLGPQVCIPCKRGYDFIESEEEAQELEKTYPGIGR
jgi:hypothetical protein